MAYGGKEAAGEPLYWAIARLIARSGMQAVTVRAAAAEAGRSVGFMRHYYDSKSLMLACTYNLVTDTQLRGLEEVLFARRVPIFNPTPPPPLSATDAARLLTSYLVLGEGWQLLVSVQLSYHALAHHDGVVGEAVAQHHGRLIEGCRGVLHETGLPDSALDQEALDLWVVMTGLTALVPGLATEDPETKHTCLTEEQVEGILRRHLEAALARRVSPGGPALDAAG